MVLRSITTALADLTLWVLKGVDLVIPREHRPRLTVTCAAQWIVLEDVPRLVHPMKDRARFHEQKRSLDPDKMDYSFELSWRRPELDGPPIKLLQTVDRHFPIKSFELTKNNGR